MEILPIGKTTKVANHSPHSLTFTYVHQCRPNDSALTVHVAASCGFGMEATVAQPGWQGWAG